MYIYIHVYIYMYMYVCIYIYKYMHLKSHRHSPVECAGCSRGRHYQKIKKFITLYNGSKRIGKKYLFH